jgi:hypothetical protein
MWAAEAASGELHDLFSGVSSPEQQAVGNSSAVGSADLSLLVALCSIALLQLLLSLCLLAHMSQCTQSS